jgi:hypothetical protein
MTLLASVASMFCSLSLGAAPAPTVAVAVVPAETVCRFVVLNPDIDTGEVVDAEAQVSPDLGDDVADVGDGSEVPEISPDKVVLVSADELLPADVVIGDEEAFLPADVYLDSEDAEAFLPADVFLDSEDAEAFLPADVYLDSEDAEAFLPADVFTDMEIEIESALAALPTPPLFADTGAEFEGVNEVEEDVAQPDSPPAVEESEVSTEESDGEAAS